jgi:hypothetical protein
MLTKMLEIENELSKARDVPVHVAVHLEVHGQVHGQVNVKSTSTLALP